jgi:hypothetical protein
LTGEPIIPSPQEGAIAEELRNAKGEGFAVEFADKLADGIRVGPAPGGVIDHVDGGTGTVCGAPVPGFKEVKRTELPEGTREKLEGAH